MKRSLEEAITKWLHDSVLKVNKSKMEMCLFNRNDRKNVIFNLKDIDVTSTPQIIIQGIIFDSKLQWTEQISNAIKKANKSLLAIKLIAKYFNHT